MADRVFSVTWRNVTFYFSSRLHSSKFCQYVNKLETLPVIESLRRRFRLPGIRFVWLEVIQKYRQIETAGFLIKTAEGEATCPEQLIFTDHVQIRKLHE